MKRMLIGLAALAVASVAQAAEPVNLSKQIAGYTYFNRPGADPAQHDADLQACYGAPGMMNSYMPQGLIQGLMVDAWMNQMRMAGQENCMVVRGWRVVRVPDDEGAALKRLSQPELAKALAPWIGASEPHGEVVRVWGNDGVRVSTIANNTPRFVSSLTLSNLALPKAPPPKTANWEPPKWRPTKLQILRDSEPEALAAPPAEYAVIVMTARNSAPRDWTRVSLLRLAADDQTVAWTVDGKPDLIAINFKANARDASGVASKTLVVAVPAGRWALALGVDMASACLGAPFFDVKPGEVVYGGAIDYGVDGLPIDLDLAPARARLRAQPDLAARLRPAQWTNGATFPCGFVGYALEHPDMPFAEGYRRAGAR